MVSLGNSAEVLKLQLEYERLEAAEQEKGRAFQREFELKRLEAEQKKREYEREREASERENRREIDLKRLEAEEKKRVDEREERERAPIRAGKNKNTTTYPNREAEIDR